MTLRVSFLKVYKETLKCHLTAVLITIFAFVMHFITFFMEFQNIVYRMEFYEDNELYYEQLYNLCAPNVANGILALTLGLFLAYDFFRYMHSKKQTDFYESLPLKREYIFFVLFFSSFTLFTLISTITLILEYIVTFSYGLGSILILKAFLYNFLSLILVFYLVGQLLH